jgi:hypothetical protein
MTELFYLANLKFSGWLSRTGQVTSERSEAKTFTYSEALAMCKKAKEAGKLLIPVPTGMMDRI